MADNLTRAQQNEAAQLLGEMAAGELYAVIHERFEALRNSQGLTQAEIAARIGVPEQQVSRWLTAPRNMTIRGAGRMLAAMDAYLHFDLETFESLYAHTQQPSNSPVSSSVKSDLKADIQATSPTTTSILNQKLRVVQPS